MSSPEPQQTGWSTGAKVLVGCAVAALLVIVLVCGGTIYFGKRLVDWGMGKVDEFAQGYEDMGYERVSGQVITVTQPVQRDTVYVAQVVKLTADVNGNLAIMSQVTEIESTVNGDIDFYGQILHVTPTGVVKGDIRVEGAQVVNIEGKVEGKITGTYGTLQGSGASQVGTADAKPEARPQNGPAEKPVSSEPPRDGTPGP